MRNLATIEVINQIISCEDLLECADLLSLYAKLAYQEKQRKAYIKAFNIHLTDAAFLLAPRLNWSQTVNYDDYKFITGSEAIKCYLRFTVDTELTPVRYLKSLEELADTIKKDFSEPSGNCLNQEFIDQSIKHLNKQYSFVEKYYQVHEPTFIFFKHCHKVWNSVCVPTVNYLGNKLFYVMLFHLKKGVSYSPEYVFLHELGHVVQSTLDSSDRPPESFYTYLHGDAKFQTMSVEEQRELFSDGFASTILYEMGLKSLDPFNEQFNQKMSRYFQHII